MGGTPPVRPIPPVIGHAAVVLISGPPSRQHAAATPPPSQARREGNRQTDGHGITLLTLVVLNYISTYLDINQTSTTFIHVTLWRGSFAGLYLNRKHALNKCCAAYFCRQTTEGGGDRHPAGTVKDRRTLIWPRPDQADLGEGRRSRFSLPEQ